MEKCSFCVQRIKEGKNNAADENRPVRDGDIVTACQEVCPTNAITFGDLNDKESAVSKLLESKRQYGLLEELNTAPRVRYQVKIRNTDRVAEAHDGGEEKHEAAEQGGHA
jgi:molybdopterin-containing oxidoreductase family iron-sulfur binding subunit